MANSISSTSTNRKVDMSEAALAAYYRRRQRGDYGVLPSDPVVGIAKSSSLSSAKLATSSDLGPKLWYPEGSKTALKASLLADKADVGPKLWYPSLSSDAAAAALKSKHTVKTPHHEPAPLSKSASKAALQAAETPGEVYGAKYLKDGYEWTARSDKAGNWAHTAASRTVTLSAEDSKLAAASGSAALKQGGTNEQLEALDIVKIESLARDKARQTLANRQLSRDQTHFITKSSDEGARALQGAELAAAKQINIAPAHPKKGTDYLGEQQYWHRQDVLSLVSVADRNVRARLAEVDKDVADRSIFGSSDYRAAALSIANENSKKRTVHQGKVDVGGGLYMTQEEIDDIARRNVQPTLEEVGDVAEKKREADRVEAERVAAERQAREEEKQRLRSEKEEQRAKAREEKEAKDSELRKARVAADQEKRERKVAADAKRRDAAAARREEKASADKARKEQGATEAKPASKGLTSRLLGTITGFGGAAAGVGAAGAAGASSAAHGAGSAAHGAGSAAHEATHATGHAKDPATQATSARIAEAGEGNAPNKADLKSTKMAEELEKLKTEAKDAKRDRQEHESKAEAAGTKVSDAEAAHKAAEEADKPEEGDEEGWAAYNSKQSDAKSALESAQSEHQDAKDSVLASVTRHREAKKVYHSKRQEYEDQLAQEKADEEAAAKRAEEEAATRKAEEEAAAKKAEEDAAAKKAEEDAAAKKAEEDAATEPAEGSAAAGVTEGAANGDSAKPAIDLKLDHNLVGEKLELKGGEPTSEGIFKEYL